MGEQDDERLLHWGNRARVAGRTGDLVDSKSVCSWVQIPPLLPG